MLVETTCTNRSIDDAVFEERSDFLYETEFSRQRGILQTDPFGKGNFERIFFSPIFYFEIDCDEPHR